MLHKLISETTSVAETVSQEAQAATQNQTSLFDGDFFSFLMLAMLIGLGVYCIYTYIRLRRQLYLFPNKVLYPGNCKPEDCIDVDGFIDYILPRMLIYGLMLLTLGAGFFTLELVLRVNSIVYSFIIDGFVLGFFVWFIIVQRKCAKEFW